MSWSLWPPGPAVQSLCRVSSLTATWGLLVSSLVDTTAFLLIRFSSVFQALQSNLKYSLLPRRLVISKRLAQCLHPALPSGVHLKALETYEIIFKIVGTKWLAKDLFLYSCGLFPLLAHAAMSVRPVLLGLYEKYFLPLQKLLLPSLQAFIIGLLPGLEEGSEIYDRWVSAVLCLTSLLCKNLGKSAEMHEAGQSADVGQWCTFLCSSLLAQVRVLLGIPPLTGEKARRSSGVSQSSVTEMGF